MENNDEEFIATLIQPDEYPHHLNQVAGVTTKYISFLKRKFVSKAGSEIIRYPISDCVAIGHKDERPVFMIAFGILLILLIGSILYMVAVNWDSLEPGTRVPVGMLLLAFIYGVRWTFGSRRHKLIFILKDGTRLTWKSRAGDYKLMAGATQQVVEFAKTVGLLR